MLFRSRNLAPEPYFSAYHFLMQEVMIRIRSGAKLMSAEELSSLANAVHNVPQFLVEFGAWDDASFRERYLRPHDEKWSTPEKGATLIELVEKGIRLAQARDAGASKDEILRLL